MAPKIPAIISCRSRDALEYELATVRDGLDLEETEDNWEKITNALLRLSAIIQGCAGDYSPQLVVAIKSMYRPINNAMSSERSRLSGAGTDLMATLGTSLRRAFEPLMPHFMPTLLNQAAKPSKIFVSRAKTSLLTITEHVQSPSLLHFLRLAVTDKSASLRLVATDVVFACLNCYNPPDLESPARAEDIEAIIRSTARDPSADVRKSSRKVFDAYKVLLPTRVDSFVAPLTPTMKKYLDIKAKNPAPAPAAASSRPKSNLSSFTTGPIQDTLKPSSRPLVLKRADAITSKKEVDRDERRSQPDRKPTTNMMPPPPLPLQRTASSGPVRPPPGMTVAPSRPMPHLTRPGLASNSANNGFDASRTQPVGPPRPAAQRPAPALSSSVHLDRPKSTDMIRSEHSRVDLAKSVPTTRPPAAAPVELKSSESAPRRVPKAPEPVVATHSRQNSKDEKRKIAEEKNVEMPSNAIQRKVSEMRRKEEKAALASSSSSATGSAHPRPPSRNDTRPPSRSDARPPSRSEARSARLRSVLVSSSSSSTSVAAAASKAEVDVHQTFRPSSRDEVYPEQVKKPAVEEKKRSREAQALEAAEHATLERRERRAKEKEKALRTKKSAVDLGQDKHASQDREKKRSERHRRQEKQEKVTGAEAALSAPIESVTAQEHASVDPDLQCILSVTTSDSQTLASAHDPAEQQQSADAEPLEVDKTDVVTGKLKGQAEPSCLPETVSEVEKITVAVEAEPSLPENPAEITAESACLQIETASPTTEVAHSSTTPQKASVEEDSTPAERTPTAAASSGDAAKTPTMPRVQSNPPKTPVQSFVKPLVIKKNVKSRRFASEPDSAALFMPKLGPEADAESDEEKAQLFAAEIALPESPEPDRAFLLPFEQQMCTPAPLRAAMSMKYSGGIAATPISKLLNKIEHGFDVSVISEVSESEEDAENMENMENMAMPYVSQEHAFAAMPSGDMVYPMFGGSQGDIHGFTFMDSQIDGFKGLTMIDREFDGRLPLLPRIDN